MKVSRRQLRRHLKRLLNENPTSVTGEILTQIPVNQVKAMHPYSTIYEEEEFATLHRSLGALTGINNVGDLETADHPFLNLLTQIGGSPTSFFARQGAQASDTKSSSAVRVNDIKQDIIDSLAIDQVDKLTALPHYTIGKQDLQRTVISLFGAGNTPGDVGEDIVSGLLINNESYKKLVNDYNWLDIKQRQTQNLNIIDGLLRIGASTFPAVDVLLTEGGDAAFSSLKVESGTLDFKNMMYISAKGSLNPKVTDGTGSIQEHEFHAGNERVLGAWALAKWLISKGYLSEEAFKDTSFSPDQLVSACYARAVTEGITKIKLYGAGINVCAFSYGTFNTVKIDDPLYMVALASEAAMTEIDFTSGTAVNVRTGTGPGTPFQDSSIAAPSVAQGRQETLTVSSGARTAQRPAFSVKGREEGMPYTRSLKTTVAAQNLSRASRENPRIIIVNNPMAVIVLSDFKTIVTSGGVSIRLFKQGRITTAELANIADETAKSYATIYQSVNALLPSLSAGKLGGIQADLGESPLQNILAVKMLFSIKDFCESLKNVQSTAVQQPKATFDPSTYRAGGGTFSGGISTSVIQTLETEMKSFYEKINAGYATIGGKLEDHSLTLAEIFKMLDSMAEIYGNYKNQLSSMGVTAEMRLQFFSQSANAIVSTSGRYSPRRKDMPLRIVRPSETLGGNINVQLPGINLSDVQRKFLTFMIKARDNFNNLLTILDTMLRLFEQSEVGINDAERETARARLAGIKRLNESASATINPVDLLTYMCEKAALSLLFNAFNIITADLNKVFEAMEGAMIKLKSNMNKPQRSYKTKTNNAKTNNAITSNHPNQILTDFGGTEGLASAAESRLYENILKALLKQTK